MTRDLSLAEALAIPGREGRDMRKATPAHPDCICGQPTPDLPPFPDVDYTDAPWGRESTRKWLRALPQVRAYREQVADLTVCLQHGPRR